MKHLKSISDLLENIEQSNLLLNKEDRYRVWFRGHSSVRYKLEPGVYRTDFVKTNSEDRRLTKEQQLTQDFKVFSAGLRKGTENDQQIYFLQQHYGMPTRLLDWTNNPLAALFFAVSGSPTEDGEIFMMNAQDLAKEQKGKYKKGQPFVGIATSNNPLFIDAIDVIFKWLKKEDFPSIIIPVRAEYFDIRMSLQKSNFTFHVPGSSILSSKHTSTLQSFKIPFDCKTKLLKDLAMLGIDDFNIYGDMQNLSKTLKYNNDIK